MRERGVCDEERHSACGERRPIVRNRCCRLARDEKKGKGYQKAMTISIKSRNRLPIEYRALYCVANRGNAIKALSYQASNLGSHQQKLLRGQRQLAAAAREIRRIETRQNPAPGESRRSRRNRRAQRRPPRSPGSLPRQKPPASTGREAAEAGEAAESRAGIASREIRRVRGFTCLARPRAMAHR